MRRKSVRIILNNDYLEKIQDIEDNIMGLHVENRENLEKQTQYEEYHGFVNSQFREFELKI